MPIKINKPLGLTPLELINKYKSDNNFNGKMSFAGRLDPMAYGQMILLKENECKQQDIYCGKKKIYEFKIIYGLLSDTQDILGLIKERKECIEPTDINYIGEYLQPYPIFSSKTLKKTYIDDSGKTIEKNKPLWWWFKKKKLELEEIPKKKVNIYEMEKLDLHLVNNDKLLSLVLDRISTLTDKNKGKFRYNEIKTLWEEMMKKRKFYKIGSFKVKVSSGTYIRSLCDRMGGVAFDINRINIIF